ncbi:MAG: zinc ABC transporter substrate-binding protein [Cyanobium sp. MAG_137]|uniref:metal ABC transporter solute-binding protein, Zn/Mn family n=1 Tax=Cyanobium sp. TaxID=2164130 RepID=UPI00276CBB95|nr:zinc ABC transporter substrate-binding protein [Cyanobium sp. MAG_185]MDP4881791.1 zinc ABC transporter substrate-binding protein [Cyanobium sp. MAG_137]MDP4948270.1 zinc ABC transporter substrate-binding protein [Cyanobium sp. MAG_102]
MTTLLARAGAFSLALALAACGAPRQAPPDAAADKAFKVVTTFLPITLFTRAVAGDCATVTALIPPSLGPHDFQSKPGDLTALRQAGVLVKNGLEMEGFLGKLVAAAENPQLVVIDSSRGVATLESAEHGDGHDHDGDHDHGAVNPHIWLDPLRAVQQVATIRDGLIQADPSCADGYQRNAAAFTAQLKQLNSEIASQLEPYRGKTFVAFHDFAPYFAQRYGLKADYLVDVPELNPSPADLQRVAAEVKSSQLKALLSEPQEGNRSFNTLAKDLGVKVVVFDPMETATEEASRDPATYVSVMRRNVADLRQAFGQ